MTPLLSSSPSFPQVETFLRHLFPPNTPGKLTLTAIHPDGQHPTPSRHLSLSDPEQFFPALRRLMLANAQGWGAYFAVGSRRTGLSRWQRGGIADIVQLSALFADLDDPSPTTLARLKAFRLSPSCIVDSGGGGFHAYWWLTIPTSELNRAGQLLCALAAALGGDSLSVAQSLRLPHTINTKPGRGGVCHILELNEQRYSMTDFETLLKRKDRPPRSKRPITTISTPNQLNQELIDRVVDCLFREYAGYRKRNGYIAALCPCGHRHDFPGKHFNFDPGHGVGRCFGRHGQLLLTDLCHLLDIHVTNYDGILLPV